MGADTVKKIILPIVSILAVAPMTVSAETSANFGWVSEYIFRGISQDDSSVYVGFDYEESGFYAGTWAADVGQGAEVDLYLGYGGELIEGLNYGIGATGYFYTDDFDDTYKEINLSLGYDAFSLDAAFGQYQNFAGPTEDYSFIALKGEYKSFYALVGTFGRDFDGEYYEVGYSLDMAGFDVSISWVHGTSSLLGTTDNSIIFSIGKSVEL